MNNITIKNNAWHTLEVNDVFKQINSRPGGLTQEEAEKRLSEFGLNKLRPPKKKSPVMRFLMQFHNVLIYV